MLYQTGAAEDGLGEPSRVPGTLRRYLRSVLLECST